MPPMPPMPPNLPTQPMLSNPILKPTTLTSVTNGSQRIQARTMYPVPSSVAGTEAVLELLRTQKLMPANQSWAAPSRREHLEEVLHHMATAHQPELFIGRFLLMRERTASGQAVIQFARSGDGGFYQYAIKCVPNKSITIVRYLAPLPYPQNVTATCRCCTLSSMAVLVDRPAVMQCKHGHTWLSPRLVGSPTNLKPILHGTPKLPLLVAFLAMHLQFQCAPTGCAFSFRERKKTFPLFQLLGDHLAVLHAQYDS
jgi:hypothetical protein